MSGTRERYMKWCKSALNEALWTPPAPSDTGAIGVLNRQALLIRAEAVADMLRWLEEEPSAPDQPVNR